MKVKDIKKKLQKEIDSIVPDVLPRVKATPINRLLTADTPSQVFRRKLATRLLALTLAIFSVMAIALAAMLFQEDKPTPFIGDSVVLLSVERENGADEQFILAVDGNGSVLGVYDSLAEAPAAVDLSRPVSGILKDLAAPAAGDALVVSVLNDSASSASACVEKMHAAATAACSGTGAEIYVRTGTAEDKAAATAAINSAAGEPLAADDASCDALAQYLLRILEIARERELA